MEQADVVRHVLGVLQFQELKYAIVGSFASIAYGEPRFTHDIDILVELNKDQIARNVLRMDPHQFRYLIRRFGRQFYFSFPS